MTPGERARDLRLFIERCSWKEPDMSATGHETVFAENVIPQDQLDVVEGQIAQAIIEAVAEAEKKVRYKEQRKNIFTVKAAQKATREACAKVAEVVQLEDDQLDVAAAIRSMGESE